MSKPVNSPEALASGFKSGDAIPATTAAEQVRQSALPGVNRQAAALPDSPCVAVCSTLFDDVCRGCGRTAIEVSTWVVLTPEQKQQVWERILAQGYPRRRS